MPRRTTPSFVAESPLRTTPAQERLLEVRLEASRHIYNASLGEALRRLARMREDPGWQSAREMPRGRERTDAFRASTRKHGFTAPAVQKFAEACRDACWIGEHLGSHDTQTMSKRAFRAVQEYAFGKRGRPRFKGKRGVHSVEGKANTVIRFQRGLQDGRQDGVVHWGNLSMPLLLDSRDRDHWQRQVLACPTKYVRVLRRVVRGRMRWYAQLVQEGEAPIRRGTEEGVVGADLGPSTIAAVSGGDAVLEGFCPGVVQPWREMRQLERAMDRSRRATNQENYNPDGTIRPGRKTWVRSRRYRTLQAKKAETERRLAAERKRAHGELVNRLLGQGTVVRLESLSYLAWQKRFGRSVKVRAPGMFALTLTRKAARAGGGVEGINPWKTRLSQYDHTTDEYQKKPLSERVHILGDGSGSVQRDIYSAFLALHTEENKLDARKVKVAFSGAGPLLERAASRAVEFASGERFPLPPLAHGREAQGRGRADRPFKKQTLQARPALPESL